MRAEKSFSINFITRKGKSDKNLASIFARVTVDGEWVEISTGERVLASEWHSASETVKGKGRDAKAANDWIEDVRFKIKESKRALEMKNSPATCHAIKSYYLGKHKLQRSSEAGKTFQDLYDFHKEVEFDSGNLKKGTVKNYGASLTYMQNFLKAKFGKKVVELTEFQYKHVLELESFIRQNPIKAHDPCRGNGLAKHMERFVKLFKMAKDIHWIEENPFDNYSVTKKKVVRERLKLQHFAAIDNAEFMRPKLEFVKDLFIYDCLVGLSYIDLMAISENDFEMVDGTMFCTIYRQKSDEIAGIPVPVKAIRIMEKYISTVEAKRRGKIFPFLSNQAFNSGLKVIAETLKIPVELETRKARAFFARELHLKKWCSVGDRK